MEPTLRFAGVKESDDLVGEQQQAHQDREHDDGSVPVTLYVTVHSEDGGSNVVPLSFSSADDVPEARATQTQAKYCRGPNQPNNS